MDRGAPVLSYVLRIQGGFGAQQLILVPNVTLVSSSIDSGIAIESLTSDPRLQPGAQYRASVLATSSLGNSSWSPWSSLTVPPLGLCLSPPVVPPTPERDLSMPIKAGQINLFWNASSLLRAAYAGDPSQFSPSLMSAISTEEDNGTNATDNVSMDRDNATNTSSLGPPILLVNQSVQSIPVEAAYELWGRIDGVQPGPWSLLEAGRVKQVNGSAVPSVVRYSADTYPRTRLGSLWAFKIRAIQVSGLYSPYSSTSVLSSGTLPSAPRKFQLWPSPQGWPHLSWKVPLHSGHSHITGYKVRCEGNITWVDVPNSELSYTLHRQISPGYRVCEVMSVNAVGEGGIASSGMDFL